MVIMISSRINGCLTFANYEGRIVLTSSMEPEIPPGSIVFYDKNTNKQSLKPGDVITYYHEEYSKTTPITHRIINIYYENEVAVGYICKGDAVTKTEKVYYKDILGKVTYSSLGLGNVILFIQKPAFIIISSAVLFVIAAIMFILPETNKDKELENQKAKEIEELSKRILELENQNKENNKTEE